MYQAMLDRAGIPHGEAYNGPDGRRVAGGVSVWTSGNPYDYEHVKGEQPHPGGYSGFLSEHIFTADGALWAVWVWE
jgi:hypothetical protein